jgi:sugar/nucleoside kinase (ribokinase family)
MTRVVVVGDVAVDVLVTAATPPVPGADVPAAIRTAPGGEGANTATWLAHHGADVVLVARVGADAAGRAAADDLRAAGVEPVLAVDGDTPTATVVVLLGDGDRTMLSDRGAAARLSPADLPDLTGADHCTCRATCCSTRPRGTPGSRRSRRPGRPGSPPRWIRRRRRR